MPKVPGANGNSKLGAGVAGASGGTGLLALVNSIPDTNHWKPLLTFASPTMAVAISGLWVFAMARLDNWVAERSLSSELTKAEAALQAIEVDQQSSERVRKEARAKVEALRLLKLTLHANRAQAIVKS
jgi:hypothetical protein